MEHRDAAGLPLGVQVVGRPWQEELVLGVMAELESLRSAAAAAADGGGNGEDSSSSGSMVTV